VGNGSNRDNDYPNADVVSPIVNWEQYTVFKDTVFGYISIPKPIVKQIIDHDIFQRLHDIAQTGMEVLYPGATHNRFCHSIGVYYLGKIAISNFIQNVKRQYPDTVYYFIADEPATCDLIWNRWEFLFEMACLLHDCGHAPLSHTLEFIYDLEEGTTDPLSVESSSILVEFFGGKKGNFAKCFFDEEENRVKGAAHERMSACLLTRKDEDKGYYSRLYTLVRAYMEYYCASVYNDKDGKDDYKRKYKEFNRQYDIEAFKSDLEFMVRAIIGCPYDDNSKFWGVEGEPDRQNVVYQVRNCIISLLNSKIDVDNIDHSVRDASASGYKSTEVDYERLLKSQTIALAYEYENLKLDQVAFDYSVCLSKFAYQIVGKEHTLELMISGSATLLFRSQDREDQKGLTISGNIIEDDESGSDKDVRVIHLQPESSVNIKLSDGVLEITPRYKCKLNGAQVYLRSEKLSGNFSGSVFIGPGSTPRWEEKSKKLHIYSAYHKSALSVIQGALDAANFESLWIYSHHVTTYTNEFLSVYLLDRYAEYQFHIECEAFFAELAKLHELCDNLPSIKRAGPNRMVKYTNEDQKKFEKAKKAIKNLGKGEIKLLSDLFKFYNEVQPNNNMGEIEIGLLRTVANVLYVLEKISTSNDDDVRNNKIQTALRQASLVGQVAIDLDIETAAGESIEGFRTFMQKFEYYVVLSLDRAGAMKRILGMPGFNLVNGQVFSLTSDADIRSIYHSFRNNANYKQKEENKDLLEAIDQYISRKYFCPMWKSHAEYHFYIQGWRESLFHPFGENPNNKNVINRFFQNDKFPVHESRNHSPVDDREDPIYLLFSDNTVHNFKPHLKEFWDEVKGDFGFKTLVYVPQKIRHKELDISSTYVVWKKQIVTLRDIGFKINPKVAGDFFYLYYELQPKMDETSFSVVKFMKVLENAIYKFARSLDKKDIDTAEESAKDKTSGVDRYPLEPETDW
jgi:HD superfamily phosphohydrolase